MGQRDRASTTLRAGDSRTPPTTRRWRLVLHDDDTDADAPLVATRHSLGRTAGWSGHGTPPVRDQKFTFSANCMLRLSAIVVAIRPAFGLPMLAFGKPKAGWLNRLNASHRNSRFERP